MGEARAKVSTIYIKLLLSWQVHILAPWTVHFHSRCGQLLRYSDRQYILSITEHSGADAKGSLLELFSHSVESVRGQNVPGVYNAVQIHR